MKRAKISSILAKGTSPKFIALVMRSHEIGTAFHKAHVKLIGEKGNVEEAMEEARDRHPFEYMMQDRLMDKAREMIFNGEAYRVGEGPFGEAARYAELKDNMRKRGDDRTCMISI